jgi:hypothetical protein
MGGKITRVAQILLSESEMILNEHQGSRVLRHRYHDLLLVHVRHHLPHLHLPKRKIEVRPAMILDREGESTKMAKMSGIVKMLTKERNRVQLQLSGLNAALSAFAGVYSGTKPTRKKGTMSAAGRKRIAAAQRARWAKVKAAKKKSA